MPQSLPTIHKRTDRELFYCYTTQNGKKKKIYLGKTEEEATTNLHQLFTNFTTNLPQHPTTLTTSPPLFYTTTAPFPDNSTTLGEHSVNTPPKARRNPVESDWRGNSIEVADLIEAYQKAYKSQHHYRGDINRIGLVRGIVIQLFPHIKVDQFGVKQMVTIRDYLCSREGVGNKGKYSVEYVNKMLNVIRRAYKWGCEYELVDYEMLHKVQSAPNVKRGNNQLVDCGYENVIVDDDVFKTVLQFITIPIYVDILKLLRSTACRPSELLHIRGRAVSEFKDEKGNAIWNYYPETHKTKAKGKERLISFNKKEIKLLKKHMEKDPDKYWFSPSKIRGEVSDRPLDSVVVSKHLRWALKKAIDSGAIREENYFTLYSLRKTAINEYVKRFGVEVASKIAGHSDISTTDRFYNRSDSFIIQNIASRR